MSNRVSHRKSELASDEEIIAYVKRFGPLTTKQVREKFGLSETGTSNKLSRIGGLTCLRRCHGQGNLWGVKQ
jgi:predicted HTH transcriptional regulator